MRWNIPLFAGHTLKISENNKINVVIKLNLIYISGYHLLPEIYQMLDKPEPAPSAHLRMFNRPGDEHKNLNTDLNSRLNNLNILM